MNADFLTLTSKIYFVMISEISKLDKLWLWNALFRATWSIFDDNVKMQNEFLQLSAPIFDVSPSFQITYPGSYVQVACLYARERACVCVSLYKYQLDNIR